MGICITCMGVRSCRFLRLLRWDAQFAIRHCRMVLRARLLPQGFGKRRRAWCSQDLVGQSPIGRPLITAFGGCLRVTKTEFKAFEALDPFFEVVMEGGRLMA